MENMKDLIDTLKKALGGTSKDVDYENYGAEEAQALVKELIDKNIPFVPLPIMTKDDGEFLLQQNSDRLTLLSVVDEVGGSLAQVLDDKGECQCPACKANRILEREEETAGTNKTKH